VLAVVLMAVLQHANPGFLEEVFRQFTIAHQVHQITKQPVLILLDEAVQQVWIAPTKTASNCAGLGLHAHHEVIRCGVHATGSYGRGPEKDARTETVLYMGLSDYCLGRYLIAGFQVEAMLFLLGETPPRSS